VIDPACTVVFEAIPATASQMRQPPRSPEAPLFGAAIWRRAAWQGGTLTAAALILSHWPGLSTDVHRSLLFALLLIAGGGLVWLNGEPQHRLTQLGGVIGLALWLLLQAIPGLPALLLLVPLDKGAMGPFLLVVLALALLALAWQQISRRPRSWWQGAEPS
jgi:P-type Ca2+ transporter type 2C